MNKPLNLKAKNKLIDRFIGKKAGAAGGPSTLPVSRTIQNAAIPEEFTRFDRHPGYGKILLTEAAGDCFGVANPFFRVHDGMVGATTCIKGREYINFANYNYLGLSGHPDINNAAKEAIDRYGTSASASRLVAGERPVHQELEEALAALYEVEDCVVFVSGHATNVSTIATIFGAKDLVIHDSLIHNSVLEGIKLAGCARRFFPHNDTEALDQILAEIRRQFERVLIVAEGLYSMDGDLPDLPALIDIKRRHEAFLMIDEAHSFGVLGETGKGIREFFGVDGKDVDIWMGTFSKVLAGCGGFIAGERALVKHLKYAAPGFVYSVGMSPPLAAASLEALHVMLREPQRVKRLSELSQQFLVQMQAIGINTGYAQGNTVVPAIIGSSLKAVRLSNQLFEAGINVQPIIFPAVEEQSARLRFFLSTMHTGEDIEYTVKTMKRLMS